MKTNLFLLFCNFLKIVIQAIQKPTLIPALKKEATSEQPEASNPTPPIAVSKPVLKPQISKPAAVEQKAKEDEDVKTATAEVNKSEIINAQKALLESAKAQAAEKTNETITLKINTENVDSQSVDSKPTQPIGIFIND